ncbi:hypothetical protein ScPMuIL_018755 [Solemya velum]
MHWILEADQKQSNGNRSRSYGDFGDAVSSVSERHVIPRVQSIDSEDPGSISDVQEKMVKRKRRRRHPDDTSGYSTSELSDLDFSPRRLYNDRERNVARNRIREDSFDNESEISDISRLSKDPRGRLGHKRGRSRSYDSTSEFSVASKYSSNTPSGKQNKRKNSRDDYNDSRSEISLNSRVSSNPTGRTHQRLHSCPDSYDNRSEISGVSTNVPKRQNPKTRRASDSVDNKSEVSVNSRVSKDTSFQHTRKEAQAYRPIVDRSKQGQDNVATRNNRNSKNTQNTNNEHYQKRGSTAHISKIPIKPGMLTPTIDSTEPFAFIQPVSVPISIRIRKLLGPVMGVLLLIVLTASLGAAIYFATALKETQESEIKMLRANLALKIRHSSYTQNLDDLSKSDFNNLELNYCGQMDDFYRRSHFKNTYRGCEVISVRNDRINFTLFFMEKEASKTDIISVIETSAPKAEEQKNVAVVDKLEIELESITIKIEHKTEPVGFNKIVNDEEIIEPTVPTKAPPVTKLKPTQAPTEAATKKPTKAPAVTKAPRRRKTTPTTSEVYSWDPCAEYVGNYFAHPVNCSLYFHCQNSHSILRTCAPGLVFDFRNTVCVKESSDTPCPDPSKAPPEPTKEDIGEKVETATTPEPTPTKKTSAEVVKKPASMNSTNTLRPKYEVNPCATEVTPGGHYPHPEDCTKFIQCMSDGSAVNLPCAPGLVFDPEKPGCVFPPNELFCPDIKPCTDFDDGYFAHPFNCSLFIQCEFGKEKVQSCQPGLIWSSKINSCVVRTTGTPCHSG